MKKIILIAFINLISWDINAQHLLLVLLGCTLLLGRYSGYRLLELFRFRALARERQAAIDQGKVVPPGGTGGTPAP